MCRAVKNLNHPMHRFPAEVQQGDTLRSCLSSRTVEQCPSCGLFSAIFCIFVLSVSDFAPKLKCCLVQEGNEKLCVLGKIFSLWRKYVY